MASDKLFLGVNADTRNVAFITDAQRSTHMQVIGSTGTGKSKFLEHLIREDIKAGNGLCLIDPHGYLYRDILKWLQAIGWPMDKIILFDPSDDRYVTGFNPLRISAKDLSYHVDAMVRACAKVWGGEDTDKTPLLKRCLRITFHALAEHRLSLLEALYLTSPTNKIAREFLAQSIQDPIIKEQWDYFNSPKMTPKLFYDEFGSTINRLMEFLAAERLRNVLGQTERSLNFGLAMDEGYIVLANLSSGKSVSHDNARLLGALIVNDLFLHATERPPRSKPFYLYIDECGLFINEDVARILDEGRKFGLHLVLAHQHLAQLKKAGEGVYHSVMTDAKTKVVFGGLSPEDAKVLAELMFLGEINLDEYKHSLDRPTVVGYTNVWLKSYSRGETDGTSQTTSQTETESTTRTSGTSSSEGDVRGSGRSSSWGRSSSATYPGMGFGFPLNVSRAVSQGEMSAENASHISMRGYSESLAYGSSSSRGESFTVSHQESYQEGERESLKPILEDRPTATYSLQDQIWKAMDTLVNQPTRFAVVKLPGLFTKRIGVPLVRELPTSQDSTIWYYIDKCNERSDFNKPMAGAKREIDERWKIIAEGIERYKEAKERAKEEAEPEHFKTKKNASASGPEPQGQTRPKGSAGAGEPGRSKKQKPI